MTRVLGGQWCHHGVVLKGAWFLRGAGESQGGDAGGLRGCAAFHSVNPRRGVCQVALENARVQACCLCRLGGRPAWEHMGALEKSSSRQGCV